MEKKNWLKIVITADPQLAEPLSDFLVGIVGAGVEMGAEGEANYGTVTAWYNEEDPTAQERDELLARLRSHIAELEAALGIAGAEISWEMVADQDWGASWKKYFTPFEVISGLVIVPGWEHYSPQPGEQILTMDPGMAFGTGHHDTTGFSLEFLRKALEEKGGQSVLDVGTGTGILGMGALLFGAEKVMAIDNDPDAVAAAKENVAQNSMAAKMEVTATPLAEVEGVYHIVVANIIHDVLISLAEDLTARLAAGGSLILSGILKGAQAENIGNFFMERGYSLQEMQQGEEWAALWLRKRG